MTSPLSFPIDPALLIPIGWYDSCFPTKELHDAWYAPLLDNPPVKIIPPLITKIEVRTNYRVPSKKEGREGTRKGWKRCNPPKLVVFTWTANFPDNLPQFERSVYDQLKDRYLS